MRGEPTETIESGRRTCGSDQDVDSSKLLLDFCEGSLDSSLVGDVDSQSEGLDVALLDISVLLCKKEEEKWTKTSALRSKQLTT